MIPYTLLCKRTTSEYGTAIWLDKWSFGILTGSEGGKLKSIRIFLYKSGGATEPFGSATLSLNNVADGYLPTSEIYSIPIADLDALSVPYFEYDGKRFYVTTITLPGLGWAISENTKYSLVLELDTPYEYNHIMTDFRTRAGATQPPDLPPSNTVPYKTTYYDIGAGWAVVTSEYKPNLIINAEYEPIVLPTVTTDPATDVEAISATLNGTLVNDGGEACDCGFEWGETVDYGNTTPTQSKTSGQDFSQPLTGLSSGTTYHFKAFATNSAGTSYGADMTFTTLFTCPYCGAGFATEGERDAHIASEHPSVPYSRAYALSREEL